LALNLKNNRKAYSRYHHLEREWKVNIGGYSLRLGERKRLEKEFPPKRKTLRMEAEGRLKKLSESPRVREHELYAYYLPLALEFIDFISANELGDSRFASSFNVAKVLTYLVATRVEREQGEDYVISQIRMAKHMSTSGPTLRQGYLMYHGFEEKGLISIKEFEKAEKEYDLELPHLIKLFRIPKVIITDETQVDKTLREINDKRLRETLTQYRGSVLKLIKVLRKKGYTEYLEYSKTNFYCLFYYVIDVQKRVTGEAISPIVWGSVFKKGSPSALIRNQYYMDLESDGELRPKEFLK